MFPFFFFSRRNPPHQGLPKLRCVSFHRRNAQHDLDHQPKRIEELSSSEDVKPSVSGSLAFPGKSMMSWWQFNIPPGRLTWNLRIHPWKRKNIFQTIIFRFYVNLPGVYVFFLPGLLFMVEWISMRRWGSYSCLLCVSLFLSSYLINRL